VLFEGQPSTCSPLPRKWLEGIGQGHSRPWTHPQREAGVEQVGSPSQQCLGETEPDTLGKTKDFVLDPHYPALLGPAPAHHTKT
jgi:hypothetical protein